MTKNRGDWALRSRTQRPTYLAHGNSSPHWRCRSCPLARSRTRSKKGFRHNTNHATPRLEKAGRAAFVDAIEHALSGNKRLRQAAAAIVFRNCLLRVMKSCDLMAHVLASRYRPCGGSTLRGRSNWPRASSIRWPILSNCKVATYTSSSQSVLPWRRG